jgi:acetyl-CoA acetyltransferase
MPGERMEDRVVISGVGRSMSGRRVGLPDLDLTLDACLAAIADAGLSQSDIDGLVTWPGEENSGSGFGGPGTATLQETLRLNLAWEATGGEGFNVLGSLIPAIMSVATGYCRHTLVYRTLTEATARSSSPDEAKAPAAFSSRSNQWHLPYGSISPAIWAAWQAQLHFARYGMSREHLAAIAINERRNASLNPSAIYRSTLTIDEYMSSRIIATPLCLYDCDVPADGSIAVVLSSSDYARDAPKRAVRFEAIGSARRDRAYWEQRADLTTMRAHDAASHMWSRTTATTADVDFAQLYDGFSIFVPAWLEALGFCGRGESKDFIGSGERISLKGALPVNTAGGQLSEGRYVGWGLLYEACLQLRGEAGHRQVADAEVGVVGAGGGNVGQALLLRRQD